MTVACIMVVSVEMERGDGMETLVGGGMARTWVYGRERNQG